MKLLHFSFIFLNHISSMWILILSFVMPFIAHLFKTSLGTRAQARAQRVFYFFFGKKLIIYIHYNLRLQHFLITKKIRGVIYIDLSIFLLLLGLTHYFNVCVLSGALSSSYYFCQLFFLHLSLTLYFFVFVLGWNINNFVKLHSRHIGWIWVSKVVVNLSSSC